ncbi:regulatory YrvL family protein [Neobacillus sedimentimangrovi]|uniref:Regulatory YrvL family protein n=1 Tax=Neobacillus sedimentimangrovi TaxID=2699460 RepID=A0ABS8QGB6_9BACI|nr:YrvL family regulatory protein [Neobacillus sedimentimangrovi]MCD4838226.1 regulatory YrvL family protein [Neobacillus sedimentimangrovi]
MNKLIVVAAITLLVVLAISITFGSIFFEVVGFFKLLRVSYQSFSSLLLFIFLYFIIGLILDFISIVFIKLATQNITGKTKPFIIRMIIDCLFSWIAFHTADEIIGGIDIPLITEIIAVLFFYLVEIAFEAKEKGKGE